MKTLDELYRDGIKEYDWTYCKEEYAPHAGCKVGMPEEFTPDDAKQSDVKICYIVTGKFRGGKVEAHDGMMFLSDGRFYWYENLWDDEDEVGSEITDEWFMEPIAWIPYMNIPESSTSLPVSPCNAEAVPTPPFPDDDERPVTVQEES